MAEAQCECIPQPTPHAGLRPKHAAIGAVVCMSAIVAAMWLPAARMVGSSAGKIAGSGAMPSAEDATAARDAAADIMPLSSRVWWMAPFFSGGGYSSEAISFAAALSASPAIATGQLWISQHGDGFRPGIMQVMPCFHILRQIALFSCDCIALLHLTAQGDAHIQSCHTCARRLQR